MGTFLVRLGNVGRPDGADKKVNYGNGFSYNEVEKGKIQGGVPQILVDKKGRVRGLILNGNILPFTPVYGADENMIAAYERGYAGNRQGSILEVAVVRPKN